MTAMLYFQEFLITRFLYKKTRACYELRGCIYHSVKRAQRPASSKCQLIQC